MKKFHRTIISFCICLISIFLIQQFGLESQSFWLYFSILVVLVFIGVIWSNQKNMKKIEQELQELEPLLQKNPAQYTKDMEWYLEQTKGNRSRSMTAVLLSNMGAGYMAQQQYETALEKLLTVPDKGLNVYTAQLYYIRLALTLFHLNKYKSACKLLVLKANVFEQIKNNEQLCHYYHILQILAMIADVKRKEARQYFMSHPELQKIPECQKEIEFINKKL